MTNPSKREGAATAMRQINQAWLGGRLDDLAPMLHPEIVMVLPDFAGRVQGREELLAGFRDFSQNATISVPADDTVAPAGICGCSRSKAGPGLPSGGPCSTWKKTPPNV